MTTAFRRYRGFSLLETTLVVCLVAVLTTAALGHFQKMRANTERTAMRQQLESLREALRLQIGSRLLRHHGRHLAGLPIENPFDWLERRPDNYGGEITRLDTALEAGKWYYHTKSAQLIYQVRHSEQFRGGVGDFPRIQFKIFMNFADRNSDGRFDYRSDEFQGAQLNAVVPYRWGSATPESPED